MTTCLLDRDAHLQLQGGRLTVKQPETANRYLPLNQIERVVIRAPGDPTLQALLALAEAGRPVHFINARGEPVATLTPHKPVPHLETMGERLVAALFRNSGSVAYDTWLDNQRSHVCSRLIRHRRAADWRRVEAAVMRYLHRGLGSPQRAKPLLREIHGLLWAWLDSRFQRLGLYDVAEVLNGRGCAFQTDMETLLSLPLRFWLVPMLRQRPDLEPRCGELFQHFEISLEERLWLHLTAMNATLNQPERVRRRTPRGTHEHPHGG